MRRRRRCKIWNSIPSRFVRSASGIAIQAAAAAWLWVDRPRWPWPRPRLRPWMIEKLHRSYIGRTRASWNVLSGVNSWGRKSVKSAALLVASPRVFAPAVRAIFMGEFQILPRNVYHWVMSDGNRGITDSCDLAVSRRLFGQCKGIRTKMGVRSLFTSLASDCKVILNAATNTTWVWAHCWIC